MNLSSQLQKEKQIEKEAEIILKTLKLGEKKKKVKKMYHLNIARRLASFVDAF